VSFFTRIFQRVPLLKGFSSLQCPASQIWESRGVQRCPESRGVQSPAPRAIPAADPWLPQGWERHRSSLASLTSNPAHAIPGRAASSGLESNFLHSKPLLSNSGHIWRHNVAMQLYQQIAKQPNRQRLPCTSLPVSPLDKTVSAHGLLRLTLGREC